ncbi:hypothetical protein JCM3770_007216 [Rhodotorula araucariae]
MKALAGCLLFSRVVLALPPLFADDELVSAVRDVAPDVPHRKLPSRFEAKGLALAAAVERVQASPQVAPVEHSREEVVDAGHEAHLQSFDEFLKDLVSDTEHMKHPASRGPPENTRPPPPHHEGPPPPSLPHHGGPPPPGPPPRGPPPRGPPPRGPPPRGPPPRGPRHHDDPHYPSPPPTKGKAPGPHPHHHGKKPHRHSAHTDLSVRHAFKHFAHSTSHLARAIVVTPLFLALWTALKLALTAFAVVKVVQMWRSKREGRIRLEQDVPELPPPVTQEKV